MADTKDGDGSAHIAARVAVQGVPKYVFRFAPGIALVFDANKKRLTTLYCGTGLDGPEKIRKALPGFTGVIEGEQAPMRWDDDWANGVKP